jgi:hypothetical protein
VSSSQLVRDEEAGSSDGPDGLNGDDFLALVGRNRVADSHIFARQVKLLGAWQRVVLRKRISERRHGFLQQVGDHATHRHA